MQIDFDNDELEGFILYGLAKGRPYSKWKSNRQLRADLDKVMKILRRVPNCQELTCYGALNYEVLKYGRTGQSSVRLGFKAKFRLIFVELDNRIRIKIIELNEHYGDK